MKLITTSLTALCACVVLALTAAPQAQAAEKVDGTWTWTMQPRGGGGGGGGGQARTTTLTLKTDGDKLTGKVSTPGRGQNAEPRVTEIENGKVKGNEISFDVSREFNGNKFTTKYSGKVEGDTIKGTMEMPGRNGGEPMKRDWEAKRSK